MSVPFLTDPEGSYSLTERVQDLHASVELLVEFMLMQEDPYDHPLLRAKLLARINIIDRLLKEIDDELRERGFASIFPSI